jgi:hypothetical protein
MGHNIGYSVYGQNVGVGNKLNKGSLISRKGFVSGASNQEFRLNDPSAVVFFDDFLGDLVRDEWNYVEGTDSGTAVGAVSAAVNGMFRLTPGDSDGTFAADGAQLNLPTTQWKATNGNLVFQTRVKLAEITSVSAFFGFTDITTLEQPIYSAASANTLTTDATDAVGFMFDTNMGTDNWWMVGVANNVDATAQNVGYAPVAATYETFRIEIDTAGRAIGYRNGIPVGGFMTGAVTASVALFPTWCVRPLSAAADKHLDIDYAYIASDRV